MEYLKYASKLETFVWWFGLGSNVFGFVVLIGQFFSGFGIKELTPMFGFLIIYATSFLIIDAYIRFVASIKKENENGENNKN